MIAMKLEDIGFYTLSNRRASMADETTSLWRCELVFTDLCNFKCPYCRGVRPDCKGTMSLEKAKKIVMAWGIQGLKNIRFSGGEPTLFKEYLLELVTLSKSVGINRIAISTNGSANLSDYIELVGAGVNDISISLDACCSSTGKIMSGGVEGAWEKVTSNIKELSKITYVIVGIVLSGENISEAENTVLFAHTLGVADIRVIPAAQFGFKLADMSIPDDVLLAHPILKYRISNARASMPIRGIGEKDCKRCPLVLDDMAIAGGMHFPCIIYFREGGNPIGDFDPSNSSKARKERGEWARSHDCFKDPICSKNCLDVCVDYNNTWSRQHADIL